MAPDPESRDLTGLARSLDELFHRTRPTTSRPPGLPTDEGGEEALPDDPAALTRALEGWLDDVLHPESAPAERSATSLRLAAAALTEAGRPEPVVEAVLRLAVVPPEEPGHAGALALARTMMVPAVAERLAARLSAVRDEGRRRVLTLATGRLGAPMAEALGDALTRAESRAARHAYTDALAAVGREGVDVLEAMTRDERWFVVRNAVLVLGASGGDWAVVHLTRCLAHPDPRVRRETVMALSRIGGTDAKELVPGLLDDPDPRVREAAALSSGALRVEAAVRPLVDVLRRGDEPEVEVAVLRALGRIGDPGAVEEMERKAAGSFLSRPPPEVRIAAYRGLAAMGTPRAKRVLRRGLDDRNGQVRAAVEEVLGG